MTLQGRRVATFFDATEPGWRADGIERALAAGGIELERYRRPGFTGGIAIRRAASGGSYSGFPLDRDPEPWDEDDEG